MIRSSWKTCTRGKDKNIGCHNHQGNKARCGHSGRINKRDFVCEYKTAVVLPLNEQDELEEHHIKNGLGCYIVDTQFAAPGVGRLCFDATGRFNHYGRLINHVAKKPNTRLTQPFEVCGKLGLWR